MWVPVLFTQTLPGHSALALVTNASKKNTCQNAGFCLHRNAAAVSWETHVKQLTARRKYIGPGLPAQKFKEFSAFRGESILFKNV